MRVNIKKLPEGKEKKSRIASLTKFVVTEHQNLQIALEKTKEQKKKTA